jgi:hypothetical protein
MKIAHFLAVAAVTLLLSGCATAPKLAQPDQLVAPTPVAGNTGKFMSPYTTDGVLAEWVDKAINAEMGGAIGGMAGAYAGQKLAENIPFFGGLVGQKVGNALGREVAIKMSGGEEFIRSTSDVSFDSLQDMAVWMYVNHSTHPHYQDALKSAYGIYPELKLVYMQALYNASAQAGI